jgi:hypothetical protein
MKLEFRPDFHIDLKLEILWPKLKGAFKGLNPFKGMHVLRALKDISFNPAGNPRLLRKALVLLSCIVAAIAALVFLLKIL